MTSSKSNPSLVQNGWVAVPRSHSKALAEINKNEHAQLSLDSVKVPNTQVAIEVLQYAQSELPEKTFNHSMRVWY